MKSAVQKRQKNSFRFSQRLFRRHQKAHAVFQTAHPAVRPEPAGFINQLGAGRLRNSQKSQTITAGI